MPITRGGNAISVSAPARPAGFSTKRYTGPFEPKAKISPVPFSDQDPTAIRPIGFTKKRYRGPFQK